MKPKKVVKLATAGQVRGFNPPGSIEADYDEAAKLAKDHPLHPVIVHEYTFADDAAEREKVKRELALVVRAQMAALNAGAVQTAGAEPYHVGYSLDPTDLIYRSFVTYHPQGRPRRVRKEKPWDAGLQQELDAASDVLNPPDPPLPPEDDPEAPRGAIPDPQGPTLSGSGFVYPQPLEPAVAVNDVIFDDGHTAVV